MRIFKSSKQSTTLVIIAAFLGLSSIMGCSPRKSADLLGPQEDEIVKNPQSADPHSADEVMSVQDQNDLVILVEQGSPVTFTLMLNPSIYAESMKKINNFEAQGLLRVLFNPNTSLTEVDVAPFLLVEAAPTLFKQEGISGFLESAKIEALALDRELALQPLADENFVNSLQSTQDLIKAMIPIEALQARSLGTNKGKGVTVAIIDSGIDLGHPLLQQTTDGGAKIIDFADFTGEANFSLTRIEEKNSIQPIVAELKKQKSEIPSGLDFVYQTQITEAQLLNHRQLAVDFNGDGSSTDVFAVIVLSSVDLMSKPADAYTAWVAIDANKNGSFEAQEIIETHQFGKKMQLVSFGDGRNAGRRKVSAKVDFGWGDQPAKLVVGLDIGGHGTHVAGIVSAYQPGVSLEGVAPDAQLMSVRVLGGKGSGSRAGIYKGLVYAASQGAQIANLSLGGRQNSNFDTVGPKLYRYLSQRYGTLFIAAAGNNGPTLNTADDPGAYETVLTVGAYNPLESNQINYGNIRKTRDEVFSFSSRGPTFSGLPKPDVVAPGGALSAMPFVGTKEGLHMLNGTSMAAPMAAGAAALLLSVAQQEGNSLLVEDSFKSLSQRPLALKRAMQEGARFMSGYEVFDQGYGVVQVENSLQVLRDWHVIQLKLRESDSAARVFRYLEIKGHFVEAFAKTDKGLNKVTIVEHDDVSLPKVVLQVDPLKSLHVASSANWIELYNWMGQPSGSQVENLQEHGPTAGFGYRLISKNQKDGSIRSSSLELRDSRSGVSQGKLFVLDVDPIVLDSSSVLMRDGITESSHFKQISNIKMKAGDIKRFFVKIPKNMRSIGVRSVALGRGVGFDDAKVAVIISNFRQTSVTEATALDVQSGRALRAESYVNAPVKAGEIIEILLLAREPVQESNFSIEIRASGFSAGAIDIITAASPVSTFIGRELLREQASKISVSASSWLSMEVVTPEPPSASNRGIELRSGEVYYYPVILKGEVFFDVSAVANRSAVGPIRWALVDERQIPFTEGRDFKKSAEGFYQFSEATNGYIAIVAPVVKSVELFVEIIRLTMHGASPSLQLSSEDETVQLKVDATDSISELDTFSISVLTWVDTHVGLSPVHRTILMFIPATDFHGMLGSSGAVFDMAANEIANKVLEILALAKKESP